MDRLVSRLLELSRIEASTEPMEDIDLARLIERVVERTHSAEQPVESRGEAVTIRGRAGDLERALVNLVENAVRFSPPGEPVTIEVRSEPRAVAIIVSDRGPGVPAAH